MPFNHALPRHRRDWTLFKALYNFQLKIQGSYTSQKYHCYTSKFDTQFECFSAVYLSDLILTEATETLQETEEEWKDDGTLPLTTEEALPFYFLDAHEEFNSPDVVYLFGKVYPFCIAEWTSDYS